MNSAEYRENLWKRILRGHANHMELYLAETVFGPRKPPVEASGGLDLVHCVDASKSTESRTQNASAGECYASAETGNDSVRPRAPCTTPACRR
jgi:hypothetical protein